jgi:hypothetical protein
MVSYGLVEIARIVESFASIFCPKDEDSKFFPNDGKSYSSTPCYNPDHNRNFLSREVLKS